MKSIAILTGGGPAPGMNTVVASVAKTFLRDGYRVIGLHGGYSALFTDKPRMQDLDFLTADEIFNKGGSILKMSRFKPTDEDFEKRFNLAFFTDNEVKLLVTVGGDDTASTANRIAKFLESKHYPIANIHVPKTIDNDLPLPNGSPTFGYNSAKAQGTVICTAVMEDARTSENWFVVSAMGRSAGHLALGIAGACHYPMVVIPEFFNKTEITVDKIINLVVSCIVKRKIMGINYGCAMISEGVFHSLSDEEIKNSGIHFSYDDHGHPELGKVSKAHIFNDLLERKVKALGLKVKSRPVEESEEPSRRGGLRNPLPYPHSLRPHLLLPHGHGCPHPLQPRLHGLHGLLRPSGQRLAPLPQRPSGPPHGQDSSPSGEREHQQSTVLHQRHHGLHHPRRLRGRQSLPSQP